MTLISSVNARYVCVYVFVCVYVCVYTYKCVYIYVCVFVYVCAHTCIYHLCVCVHVFVSCVLYSVGNYVYISKPIRLAVNLYRANSNSDRRYLYKLHLCYSVFMGISF